MPDRRPAHPAARPRPRGVGAAQKVPRGFALFVGLDEQDTATAGPDLRQVVERLRLHLAEIIPGSESHASVVVAPPGAGGRSIDVVRSVMGSTSAASGEDRAVPLGRRSRGVVVDLARGRVLVDGANVGATSTELALLRLLVLRPGQDVARDEVLAALWGGQHGAPPAPRTVDVHVRRLRARLGDFDDVIRTVRGFGYRFDPRPDVVVRPAAVASPARAATAAGWQRVPAVRALQERAGA